MIFTGDYDYRTLKTTYQFPLNPLVYKSQRTPFSNNIYSDINVNLASVSKVDVTLRFANDPLAFFNQKMRGNANSFGSNWVRVLLCPGSESESKRLTDSFVSLT